MASQDGERSSATLGRSRNTPAQFRERLPLQATFPQASRSHLWKQSEITHREVVEVVAMVAAIGLAPDSTTTNTWSVRTFSRIIFFNEGVVCFN